MQQIEIDNIRFIINYKRIKNLYIRVTPHSEFGSMVMVSAPNKMENYVITEFINSKLSWIKKQQYKLAERESTNRAIQYQYETGEQHYYQGKAYTLKVIYGRGLNRVILDEQAQELNLFVITRGRLSLRKAVLDSWYKLQLSEQIAQLIAKWQAIIGVRVKEYKIRQMTTRWGSCNISRQRICINLELIKKPPECLEYIIVHELVHLLERWHNKRFYAFMDKFLPTWLSCEQKL